MKNYIDMHHFECIPLNDLARGFYESVRTTGLFSVPEVEGPYRVKMQKTDSAIRLTISNVHDVAQQRVIDVPDAVMMEHYRAYGKAVVDYNYAVGHGRRDDVYLKGSERAILHTQGAAQISGIFRKLGVQTRSENGDFDEMTPRAFFGLCTFMYLEAQKEMPVPSQLGAAGKADRAR